MPTIAFYLLIWVFAVQQPDGVVNDKVLFASNKMSLLECSSKATIAAEKIPLSQISSDGDTGVYSRFVCVPVPE